MRKIEIINPETAEIKQVELPLTAEELIYYRNWELFDVDVMADFSNIDLNDLDMTFEKVNQLDSIIDEVEEWDYTADDVINLYHYCMTRVKSYDELLEALSPEYIDYCSANSLEEYAEDYLYDNYSLPDGLLGYIDLEGYGETLLQDTNYSYVESGGILTCEGWEYGRYSTPKPLTEWLNMIDNYLDENGFMYLIQDNFGYYEAFVATEKQKDFIKRLKPGYQATMINSLNDLLKDEDAMNYLEYNTLETMVEDFINDIILKV